MNVVLDIVGRTAQRSDWFNMLSLSTIDKVCVNTEIELFNKIGQLFDL